MNEVIAGLRAPEVPLTPVQKLSLAIELHEAGVQLQLQNLGGWSGGGCTYRAAVHQRPGPGREGCR